MQRLTGGEVEVIRPAVHNRGIYRGLDGRVRVYDGLHDEPVVIPAWADTPDTLRRAQEWLDEETGLLRLA